MVFVTTFFVILSTLLCMGVWLYGLFSSCLWAVERTSNSLFQVVFALTVASAYITAAVAILPWIKLSITTLRSLV